MTQTRSATRWPRYTGVAEVDDLHVWEVTSGFPALSAHVLADVDSRCQKVCWALTGLLHDEFHIDHITLQVEHEDGGLLTIAPATPGPTRT